MKERKNFIFIAFMILLIGLFTACGQQVTHFVEKESKKTQEPKAEAPENGKKATLIISAAASLKDAMKEIKAGFLKENAGVNITYNFGGSGSLQQQIEQGAPVDIFISAADKQMNALENKGLIDKATRKNLLENKVVLIVPKNKGIVRDFTGLTSDRVKRIALGEPKSVPAGQYAEEILISLKLADSIKSKSAYGKDVKEVLTWVETGNSDAGIVYETDAKLSGKVDIAATAPEGSYKPVVYPAAVMKDSKNMDAAKEFINYLYSSKAQPVFEKYGFVFLAK